jgi:hypothetical protein
VKRFIEIQTLMSGQPRPYADHDYISEFTFTTEDGRTPEYLEKNNLPIIVPNYVTRNHALAIARLYVPFVDDDDPKRDWASRRLVYFEGLKTGSPPSRDPNMFHRWRIHVRAAYTD